MSNQLDPETCGRLQKRLREAEERARQALQDPGDDSLRNATEQLLNTHREIRALIREAEFIPNSPKSSEVECAVADAAIAIEREEHEHKPEFTDILKAIFMWKDDPYERSGTNSAGG